MPLQVVCPACNAKLKAPDTAAGKKTKCPKCQGVISVPVDAPQALAATTSVKIVENWYMQTTDGSQFGPVPRSELNEWFQEGRISADCQLLKEGADQWQWASEIYPSLDQSAQAPAPTKQSSGFDILGPATPASNDPLGLGNAALGMTPVQSPAFQTPAFSYQAPAPAYSAPAPSFGGGFGAPVNPYSSPSTIAYGGNYGSQARTGLHPMVIVAAVLEFIGGGLNLLGSLLIFGFVLIWLLAGAGIASNLPQNANGADASGALAMVMGMGLLCLLPFLIVYLALGVLKIYTGIGLLKKRFWARIVAIVLAILYLIMYMTLFALQLSSWHPTAGGILVMLVFIAVNAVIVTAMFIPDCTSDFS